MVHIRSVYKNELNWQQAIWQWIKYLRINLTKEIHGLYTERHKTLLEEVARDLNKRRDILCTSIGRQYG